MHITGFHAAVGAGVVDLSGELGLENTLPFDADVKLASVNVGDILGSFGQAKLGLGGVASANLHTKGQITPLLVAANGSVALGGARYQEMIRLDKLAMRLDASVDRTGAAGNLRFKAHTTMDLQDLVYTQTVKAKPDAVAHTETVEVAAGNLTLDVSGAVPLKKGPPIDLSARGDVELQDARYADQAHVERVAVSLDGKMHIGSRVAYEAQVNLTADEVSQGDRITAQKVELVLDAGGDVTANEVRQLKLTVDGVHVKQANLTHLTLDAAGLFGPKKNEVRQFVLTTDHTRVTATGAFDLDHGPLSGVADLEFADLAEFAALVDKPLGGRGTLHLQAAGTTDHPQVEGRLDFADLLYGAINLKRISGGLGYDGNRAKVVQLVIEREGARITVDGWYDRLDSTVQAALDMPETQIAELLALAGLQDQVQVTGKLTLHAAVSGPVKKLNGQVMLTGAEITAYGENVQAVQLNARLVGGEVELDELSLVKERGVRPLIQNGVWKPRPAGMVTDADREPMKLTISGRLNPNDRTFALKLRTQQLNETASDIVAQHRLHVMADVGLTADVAGTFDNPNGSLLLTIDRGRYEQYDLGQSTIKVDFAAQQVHLTGVLLAARQAFASDVAAPHPTPTPSPTPTADPDFAASATPTPGTPAPPANPNDLGAIRLDATLGLTDARPFKARVTFDHFDYSNFLKSAAQARQQRQQARSGARLPAGNQEKFGGLVDGEIDLDGRLGASGAQQTGTAPVAGVVAPAKPSLSATVRFNQILFQRNNLLIRNQNEAGEVKPIVITYRDGRVDVQDFALGGSGVEIKIERQDLGGEAYFVLNGQAPLDTVKAFTDAVANVNGALQLHAEIPVAFDLDKVKAAVKIDNATVDLADVPTNIENLKVDVEFANRAATIRQFTAKVGGGTLRVGGSYRLPQPARPAAGTAAAPTAPTAAEHAQLEVFAKIENVTTRFDPYLELVVRKVDLLATSRPDGKIDVTGEVDINKAVLRYNIDLVQILQAFQKRSGGATGSQVYEKKEESVYFNIVIRAPQGVSIDNNFIQMEMSLDLVLTGNNVDVGLIGSVESTKGEATVLQNTYKVTSAVIQFFDETRIYPAFDVNAETTVNNINIFISVTGTPDRYQITFQSDPPMNERDIVTLLSLGVSYEQFQAGSGDEAAALAAAAQQLIGSSFRQYTGIDFGVDSTTGVSRLRVSRPLQEHFLMSLYRGISDPTLSAETEWDFTRNLGLYVGWSDFAGQENVPSYGGFGGGVRVKIEFR